MIPRIAGGWQTTMADLALILFIVSVAGLKTGNGIEADELQVQPPARGEPVAIYRAGDDAPPLAEWLAEQAPDSRQHLTIVARYRAGEAGAAAQTALALAEQAGKPGISARIVLEEGEGGEALALLAFDRPADAVARSLQGSTQD